MVQHANNENFQFQESFDFIEETAPPSNQVITQFINLKNTAEAAIHRKITAKKRAGVDLTPEELQFCQNYTNPQPSVQKVVLDGVEAGCGQTIAEKAKEAIAKKASENQKNLRTVISDAISSKQNFAEDIAAKAKLALENKAKHKESLIDSLKAELKNIYFQISEFENHLNEAKKRRAEIFSKLGDLGAEGFVSDSDSNIDFVD